MTKYLIILFSLMLFGCAISAVPPKAMALQGKIVCIQGTKYTVGRCFSMINKPPICQICFLGPIVACTDVEAEVLLTHVSYNKECP